MITGVQLVIGILLLGGVVWIGAAVARGVDGALGEKRLRDRDG